VHGVIRRSSSFNTDRIDPIFDKLHLHYGDLTDGLGLFGLLADIKPDEVYNLGAQSHVKVSFDQPVYSCDVDAVGNIRLLEAIRRMAAPPRFYQASSSEMFGDAPAPQNEDTPFNPQSPYACAKVYAYHQTRNYRDSYGLFACNGILFNHESPRRGETFVTRKITRAATRIKAGLQRELRLGNLDAKRDWGFAGDYVDAMWRMLQQDDPDDYVVATGQTHSVREFLEATFAKLGLDWEKHVVIDSRYYRPSEVPLLLGDATKARSVLGWAPTYDFDGIVDMMVWHDERLACEERLVRAKRNGVGVRTG